MGVNVLVLGFALLAADVTSAEVCCTYELIHTPRGAEVADYYPSAAFPLRVAGTSEIDCIVGKNLKFEKCVVLQEDPVGYGFGNATIKYFKKNARGKSADENGASCVGRHVKLRFKWAFS